MLRRRRLAIGQGVEAVFPDSLGNWRDPSNVRRVWREVRDALELEGFVSHTLRKTVASFLDDADVSTRKISDQLGREDQHDPALPRPPAHGAADGGGSGGPVRRPGERKVSLDLDPRSPANP
jgi:hypothetical protein